MPFVGIGVGIGRQRFGGGVDAQAQAHYDRVIADGGVVPSGLNGVNAFFNAVKSIYATSDITTAVSVGVDAQYLGYKLGAGAGATSGQAVQKLYSCAGSSGDVVQTTAASQPLLLAHSGASSDNYWYGSGVSGNLNTSSTQSAFNFGGDFSMVFDIKPLATTSMEISGCLNSLFYTFGLLSSGVLKFSGGGHNVSSTIGINTTIRQWVRISRSGNDWTFYTSANGITWTQLGTTISSAGSLSSSSINIRVGDGAGAVGNPFNGSIYRGLFYTDSTLTTLRADFNPSTYNASTSQTQWTSTTGEVWTINTGTAATGYKGALVDRTIVQSDGINDRLLSGTLTSKSTFSRYAVMNPLNLNNFVGIVGANVADRHYLYATATGVAIFNGATLTYTSEQAQRQALYEADYNGSSSVALLNNTSSNTGNAGTGSSTALELFTILGGYNANAILNTLIDRVNAGIDTPTQKTEMYNYIRSINNNAF